MVRVRGKGLQIHTARRGTRLSQVVARAWRRPGLRGAGIRRRGDSGAARRAWETRLPAPTTA